MLFVFSSEPRPSPYKRDVNLTGGLLYFGVQSFQNLGRSGPFWTALMLCYILEGVDWTTNLWVMAYKSQTTSRPLISNCPSIKKGGDFIHEPSLATVDLSLHISNIPIITTKSNCWVHACYQSNQTPPIQSHQFNLNLTQ